MSDQKEKKENLEQTAGEAAPEKKMTKYDLKMQRRAEEAKKDARESKVFTVVGICIVIALIALIASMPIRSYMAVHKTVCKVDGRDISQVEFDYYYSTFKNGYINNYGSYLYYVYGVDPATADLTSIYYDDTLNFEEYFQQQTVEQMRQNAALRKEMTAAGYSYDVTEDYQELNDNIDEAMKEGGMSEKEFYSANYGQYATRARIESYVKDYLEVSHYYSEIAEDYLPQDSEIDAYYAENADDYDMVDYRLVTISAEMPTAPTDLADEGAAVAEDGSYTPSEKEKAKAMEDAEAEANKALETISKDGTLNERQTRSDVLYYVRDWLFDSSRKSGDTTVISSEEGKACYVLEFEDRYQDEESTVSMRAIIAEGDSGEEILAKYAGTEESFIELVQEYSTEDNAKENDGLYEGIEKDTMEEEASAWLFDSARKEGDVTSIYIESEDMSYVFYYLSSGNPAWYYTIQSTLQSEALEAHLTEITEPISFEDPNGNLQYLKTLAAAEEAAAAAAAQETETTTDGATETANEGATENATEGSTEATTESTETAK